MAKKPKWMVITSDGAHLDFAPVSQIVGYNEGLVLTYKPAGGLSDTVLVGRKYRPLEWKGTFFVGKNIGNDSAADLVEVHSNGRTDKVKPATDIVGASSDPDCPGEDLSALGRSNLWGLGIKALYGKPQFNVKILLIIGIGIVVIFLLSKTGILQKLMGG